MGSNPAEDSLFYYYFFFLILWDIQAGGRAQVTQGFLRLCAGEGCYMSKKGIFKDVWTHIAVVYSAEHSTVFENHVDFCIPPILYLLSPLFLLTSYIY